MISWISTAIKFFFIVSGITKLIERWQERNRARREGHMEERLASQDRELKVIYEQEQAGADLSAKLRDPEQRRRWLREQAAGPESE